MFYIAFITFTVVASIGPTNLFAIKEGLKKGGFITFAILFGGVLTEVFYANLALYGINKIESPFIITVLQILGTFFFLYLGIVSFKKHKLSSTSQSFQKSSSFHLDKSVASQLLKGILMTLPNPLPVVLWSSAIANINEHYLRHYVITLIILSIGCLWSGAEGFFVSKFKKLVNDKTLRFIEIATAIILLIVSIKFAAGLLNTYIFEII